MEEHANSVDQNKVNRETKPEADKGETADADDAKSAVLGWQKRLTLINNHHNKF